jgi:D-alanyl-D-alanine carboxypeptidase (penicillin-binding protein 5/6)
MRVKEKISNMITISSLSIIMVFSNISSMNVWATGNEIENQSGEQSQDISESSENSATQGVADSSIITTNGIPNWPQAADVLEETGVLLDTGSGTILFNKKMDQRMYPASTTKIMTALLAIENSNLDDTVTFTETGVKDAYAGSSNIGMQVGEVLTMEQCLYAMMLKSANEVTTQVAEYIGGSVENFVNMMNQKAEELGCTGTHFNNANGLPDDNHYTTAHDLAIIGQAAIQNETFRKIIGTVVYTIEPTNKNPNARTYDNHHAMIHEGDWYYEGCLGGKTGYTDASQSTLVTFAERDGLLLVCVLMKGDGTQIVKDTKTVLDYGFNNFKLLKLAAKGDVVQGGTGIIPSKMGEEELEVKEDIQQDMILTTYLCGDYPVGTVAVTKESYEQVKAQEEQEAIEKEEKAEREKIEKEQNEKQEHTQNVMKMIILVLCGLIAVTILLVILKVILNRKK